MITTTNKMRLSRALMCSGTVALLLFTSSCFGSSTAGGLWKLSIQKETELDAKLKYVSSNTENTGLNMETIKFLKSKTKPRHGRERREFESARIHAVFKDDAVDHFVFTKKAGEYTRYFINWRANHALHTVGNCRRNRDCREKYTVAKDKTDNFIVKSVRHVSVQPYDDDSAENGVGSLWLPLETSGTWPFRFRDRWICLFDGQTKTRQEDAIDFMQYLVSKKGAMHSPPLESGSIDHVRHALDQLEILSSPGACKYVRTGGYHIFQYVKTESKTESETESKTESETESE